jgi:hypothetical protein
MLADTGTLNVLQKSRKVLEPGATQVTFEVIPIRVGNELEVALRFGKDWSSRKRLEVKVGMPAFSGRSNASFLEMSEAPDTSIYGSHITMWSGLNTQYISGHAASNICRKVSAAVIDFAISRAMINDDFFVGAGFASLPDDSKLGARLSKQLGELPQPPLVREKIQEIVSYEDVHGAYDLADVLDDPASYRPRPPGVEHFREVISGHEAGPNVDEIVAWIRAPEKAVLLLGGGSDLGSVIEIIKGMSADQRTNTARVLRKFAAFLDSENLLSREVQNVGERSGLVRIRDNSAPDTKELLPVVRDWSKSVPVGAASPVQAVAARASGETEIDDILSIFSSYLGKGAEAQSGGLVFLPFEDARAGKDVEFLVPKSLIAPDQAKGSSGNGSILGMLHESVTREMIANLEEAATRQEKYYRETVAQDLALIRREISASRSPDAWLREMRSVTYSIVDDRGRPTGQTRTERISNFRFWVGRLEFAESTRLQSVLYAQSARRVRDNAQDPKAMQINNAALLDSFLRGWDLAFVDNSNESPYREWLDAKRDAVWQEILRQASERGIDITPVVSEQTVFQVRAVGDNYRIRPMYVGNASDTTIVKSADGRLVSYRSPWMQRKIVYLTRKDVTDTTWDQAAASFNPEKPDPALRSLAADILEAAFAEADEKSMIANIRRAMVVDSQYTATRLLSDYWAMWDEGNGVRSEQAQFESVLESEGISDDEFESKIGKEGGEKFDRFQSYAVTRAFEGGLKVIRCLGSAAAAVENDLPLDDGAPSEERTKEVRAAEATAKCFSTPQGPELAALKAIKLQELMSTVSKDLTVAAGNWQFDALGRTVAVNEISDALNRVAEPLLQASSLMIRRYPTKRATAAYVALGWYGGEFRSTLTTILGTVANQVPTEEVLSRARLLASMQMDILKALVYSGMELGKIGEPELSGIRTAAATVSVVPTRPYFGIRKSDFATRPVSVERIAYRISFPDAKAVQVNAPASTEWDILGPMPEFATLKGETADAAAGLYTSRAEAGLQKAVWVRNRDRVDAVSFTDVMDEAGSSRVVKLITEQPISAVEAISVLRAEGFEVLQAKTLQGDFQKAVMLVYPDQVLLISGEDVLRFAPPTGKTDVVGAVREAFEKANVKVAVLTVDGGLAQEANHILSARLDPVAYFSSNQVFPGVLAYSRDGDRLRMLIRESDGTVWSAEAEKGGFRRMRSGVGAVEDIEAFERASLANRSDDKVEFIHTASFATGADATVRMQVGKVTRDVPASEIKALLDGSKRATPALDELFKMPPGKSAPTFIVYRDAFVRGGGGGRKLPPGPRPGAPAGGEPPGNGGGFGVGNDPDRNIMVGGYAEEKSHVPPMSLLVALKNRYPKVRIALDDILDVARTNALEPVLVDGVKDVAAYVPVRSFGVSTRGAITNIRLALKGAGVHVETSMKTLEQRNILVLSGHKDAAFENYIDAHIRAGNLKGKQILLFSCYQAGDPNLIHRMVTEGGAKGVVFFSQEIEVSAVNSVLKELADTLGKVSRAPEGPVQVIDLLDESIDKAMSRAGTSESQKKAIRVLRERVPQISAVRSDHVARAA